MDIKNLFKKKGLPPPVPVDPEMMTPEAEALKSYLLRNIVGQERAIHQLVKAYEAFQAGVSDPQKPLTNLLFLGPTGVGKTRVVEVFCEYFWRKPNAFIKIDCAEFTHSHELSKLIGAPPGYLGYASGEARISKNKLEEHWGPNDEHFSVILFDEIEKAHEDFHQLLLGVMDRGVLTLGNGQSIDLTKTFVVMTSNLGAKAVARHLNSQEIGYTVPSGGGNSDVDQDIYKTSMAAVKKFFEPEFINRIDRIIVFRALSEMSIRIILEIELDRVQKRLKDSSKYIVISCSKTAKEFLISEGVNLEFGARELRRAIERFLVNKLSRIIATGQACSGDMVQIDHKGEDKFLTFSVLKGVIDLPTEPRKDSAEKQDADKKFEEGRGRILYLLFPLDPCIFCGGRLEHRMGCPELMIPGAPDESSKPKKRKESSKNSFWSVL